MKKQKILFFAFVLIFSMVLQGCVINFSAFIPGDSNQTQRDANVAEADPPQVATEVQPTLVITEEPTIEPTPVVTVEPTPTQLDSEAGSSNQQTSGPDQYPQGISPLSGLPVTDPNNLSLRPAALSITNFPASARPQAGLSYTPLVFELFIGEGESRFLAFFYGEFPDGRVSTTPGTDPVSTGGSEDENTLVGPLRSGRLPYENLRTLNNGFLVMASGYAGVLNNIEDYNNYFGSDAGDINSAMVRVSDLNRIAASYPPIPDGSLTGNLFDPQVPEGGVPANNFWFIYNALDMVDWKYNPDTGAYHRYQNTGEDTPFIEATDRLNGDPLTYENMILLYANHRYCTEAAFAVDLMYVTLGEAVLFRDGQMFPIFWTTGSEEYEQTTGHVRPIRYIYRDGTPVALKPGQTWVTLAPLGTQLWETVDDSTAFFDLINKQQPGSGNWISRFYPESMVEDQAVCDMIRN